MMFLVSHPLPTNLELKEEKFYSSKRDLINHCRSVGSSVGPHGLIELRARNKSIPISHDDESGKELKMFSVFLCFSIGLGREYSSPDLASCFGLFGQ